MPEASDDVAAFYRRYAPDVYRFALYLCGERSDAEDITSETFVRLWASPSRIESATVSGYLCTIARNLYLEQLRRSRRLVPMESTLSDTRPSPLAEAVTRSDQSAVDARLLRLSDVDRNALLLRAVDGLPYAEIAVRLGITVASAKVKVHRARLTLADIR